MSDLEDEIEDTLEIACYWCGTPMEAIEFTPDETFQYSGGFKCPDCKAILSNPRIEND